MGEIDLPWWTYFPSIVANRAWANNIRVVGEGPEKIKPGDDLVTEVSKKVSWILRHGLHSIVGVEIDPDGYIRVTALHETQKLCDLDFETLVKQIHISNEQKKRYDVKEENGKLWIRATKDRQEKKKKPKKEIPEDGSQSGGLTRFGKGRGKNGTGLFPYRPDNDDGAKPGERKSEDDRPPKGRGKLSTHRPPPDRSSWGQKPKDTSVIGKTWVVANNIEEVLVRENVSTESDVKFILYPGQVVTQIGPDEDMLKLKITRMEISFDKSQKRKGEDGIDPPINGKSDPADLITGWVTKTAEQCQGPRFFYPPRAEKARENGGTAPVNGSRGPRWDKDRKIEEHRSDEEDDPWRKGISPNEAPSHIPSQSDAHVASSAVSPGTNSLFSAGEKIYGSERPTEAPPPVAENQPPLFPGYKKAEPSTGFPPGASNAANFVPQARPPTESVDVYANHFMNPGKGISKLHYPMGPMEPNGSFTGYQNPNYLNNPMMHAGKDLWAGKDVAYNMGTSMNKAFPSLNNTYPASMVPPPINGLYKGDPSMDPFGKGKGKVTMMPNMFGGLYGNPGTYPPGAEYNMYNLPPWKGKPFDKDYHLKGKGKMQPQW